MVKKLETSTTASMQNKTHLYPLNTTLYRTLSDDLSV